AHAARRGARALPGGAGRVPQPAGAAPTRLTEIDHSEEPSVSRAEIERRVVEYLDAHDAEAVDLLQRLVRVRSLARQEGRPDQPGTVNHLLVGELGRTGAEV